MAQLNNANCSIPCNLCGSTEVEELSLLDRHKNHLRTVICKDCGLVWTDPRPAADEVKKYYSEEYRLNYKGTYTPKRKHVYRAGKVAISRYEQLREILSADDAILDIGSGGGELVYILRRFGCNARGVEPNEGYACYSRKELEIPVDIGLVQDMETLENTYDAITMYHVLEHMEDPLAALSTLHKWIARDGFLVVEVPNIEASCQAPGHRFHFAHFYNFNPETLEALGKRAGYDVHEATLSPDGGNITTIFRKAHAVIEQDGKIPGNYDKITATIRKHTNMSYYFSYRPYARLSKKLLRAVDEKRVSEKIGSRREILDYIISNTDFDSRPQ